MPRCPSCGKNGFANHEAVARHMSQPSSGCSTWSDNLIRLHEELLPMRVHHPEQDIDMDDEDAGSPQEFYNERVGEVFEGAQGGRDLPDAYPSVLHFPGAARTFQGGTTFLDRFHADKFNECRTSNLYYPYASRGEWEIASWLLRSGLSMNAINSLLSLDLVRISS